MSEYDLNSDENYDQLVLEQAQHYAALGYPVVPLHGIVNGACACNRGGECRSPGKHPLAINGLHDATRDPDQIRNILTRNPGSNIAIRTGAESGLLVVDLDPRHDSDTSVAELARQGHVFPATLTADTGGGGQHLYYRMPDAAIPNKVAIWPGIDIRAEGGMIVAAPSRHISGGTYTWRPGAELGDVELADPPAFLLDRLRQAKRQVTPRQSSSAPGWQPLIGATEDTSIPGGERKATLTRLAGTMRRQGVSADRILDVLRGENAARCRPPLDEDELRDIARSAAGWEPEGAAIMAPLTDVGNALRLVEHARDQIRYVAGQWLVWDGRRWARDDGSRLLVLASETVRNLEAAARGIADKEQRDSIVKWALSSQSLGKLKAMIELAAADSRVRIIADDLDTDPLALNVNNGRLCLRTGELRPHEPSDLITRLAPVDYDPEAQCPRFLRFLEDVQPDPSVRAYLQCAIGYSLTGLTTEQVFFLCVGHGQNGKTTLLEAIRAVLGDYPATSSFDTFLERTSETVRNDLAKLAGVRVVTAVEADAGKRLAESFVKQVTGGDRIQARFLFREFFEFTPVFKLWLAANHKPIIKGADNGIWRRIRVIPFDHQVPDGRLDRDLPEKLRAEAPGILAWAVEGAKRYLADKRLPDCPIVAEASSGYRREMDVFGTFLEDRFMIEAHGSVSAGTLYQTYAEWVRDNGEVQLPQNVVGRMLKERGFIAQKTRTERSWYGLRLRTSFDNPPPPPDDVPF